MDKKKGMRTSHLHLQYAEYDRCQKACRSTGLRWSEWIRRAVLHYAAQDPADEKLDQIVERLDELERRVGAQEEARDGDR